MMGFHVFGWGDWGWSGVGFWGGNDVKMQKINDYEKGIRSLFFYK